MAYYRALQLKDVDGFLDLLKRHDSTRDARSDDPRLEIPRSYRWMAALYADDRVVVHVRGPVRSPWRPPARRSGARAVAPPEVRDILQFGGRFLLFLNEWSDWQRRRRSAA